MNPNRSRARVSIAPDGTTCDVVRDWPGRGWTECGKEAASRLRWPKTTLELDMCRDCFASRMAGNLDLIPTFAPTARA